MSDQQREYGILLKLLDMDRSKVAELKNTGEAARERFERFRTDPVGFAKYYFPHYIVLEPAGWHKELAGIFAASYVDGHTGKQYWKVPQDTVDRLVAMHRPEFSMLPARCDRLRALAVTAPREQAKSTFLARILVIWGIVYGKFRYVAYFRSNGDLADDFLADTVAEFEDNDRLIADFGNLRGKVWKTGMYTFKNGAAIVSLGRGASVRGLVKREKRPDLIICDDLVTEKDARSLDALDNLYDWIFGAIVNLSKDAVLFFLNTLFNEFDPQFRILRRIAERDLPNWLGVRLSGEIVDGEVALWPEYWPIEALHAKRQEIGLNKYLAEYQSVIVSDSGKIIKPENIHYVAPTRVNRNDYLVAFGVDPNAEGNDDAAISVVGKHRLTGGYHTFDIWDRDRATIQELVDNLVRLWRKYDPIVIGFENVAFQHVYMKLLLEILNPQDVHLPMIGVEAKMSKEEGVMMIQPFWENGTWTHSEELRDSEAMRRVLAFPQKGLNDGVPDSLKLGYLAHNRGAGKPIGSAGRRRPSALPGIIGRYTRNGY